MEGFSTVKPLLWNTGSPGVTHWGRALKMTISWGSAHRSEELMGKIQLSCHFFSPNIESSLLDGSTSIGKWTNGKTTTYLVHYNLKPQKHWGLKYFVSLQKEQNKTKNLPRVI